MKKIKSLLYKLYVKIMEKSYKYTKNRSIKYLFFRKKQSDSLIICFSAFPGEGNGSSKYNYLKTLNFVNSNRLYILDDFGYQRVGSYYLGENGKLDLDQYVINLINYIIGKYNISKVYTLGSSKGGTAAIYFGTIIDADMILAGAPQYFIGKYLNSNDYNKKILYGILGNNINDDDISNLDDKVRDVIIKSKNKKTKYVINFSKKEHTYDEHIKYMIEDLLKCKKDVVLEESNYDIHSDVGFVMPNLFKKYFK